jgi:hypothetical protein
MAGRVSGGRWRSEDRNIGRIVVATDCFKISHTSIPINLRILALASPVNLQCANSDKQVNARASFFS